MIKFTYDSRDHIFQNKFGGILDFPKELNFDTPLIDEVQPYGDVRCTCYTVTGIAADQENRAFDITDLWLRIPHGPTGADPRDALKEAVANGLLPVGEKVRRKDWKSYWRADLGNFDAFDNLRSAMLLVKGPVGCGTFWYQEWFNTDTLPIGKNITNGHMYTIEGWKEVNGEPHLIVEAWMGKKVYMPRATFNEAVKPYGMQTWVLSTSEIDARREKTLVETIKDLCINLIIVLRSLIKTHNVEPAVPAPIVEQLPPEPLPIVNEQAKYLWNTREQIVHSCRIIMDEYHLTWTAKALLCACIEQESNFNPRAEGAVNSNGTKDWGLGQYNDGKNPKTGQAYWIGPGADFSSVGEVLDNPEKNVRVMIREYQLGHLDRWSSFTTGAYKKYLDKYL